MNKLFLLLVLLVLLVPHGPSPAYALESTTPEIIMPSDFLAYRNVVEQGDLLTFGRFNLPADFDEEATGWAPHGAEGVLARLLFMDETTQDRVPAKLGHGLLVFYLLPGHGAAWGSENLIARMQGNPALFESPNHQDRGVSFSAPGADSSTLVIESEQRQQALCDGFVQVLQAIEQADSGLSSSALVSGDLITTQGTFLVRDSFSGAISILPTCFTVGVEGSGQPFNPPDAELRDGMVADVEASEFWGRWSTFLESHDMPVAMTTSFIGIGIAFAVMVMMTMWTGLMYGMASGAVALLAIALWTPHTLLQVVFIIAAISSVMAAAFFWTRVPK